MPGRNSHETGRCSRTPRRKGSARAHWASGTFLPSGDGELSARRCCWENHNPQMLLSFFGFLRISYFFWGYGWEPSNGMRRRMLKTAHFRFPTFGCLLQGCHPQFPPSILTLTVTCNHGQCQRQCAQEGGAIHEGNSKPCWLRVVWPALGA